MMIPNLPSGHRIIILAFAFHTYLIKFTGKKINHLSFVTPRIILNGQQFIFLWILLFVCNIIKFTPLNDTQMCSRLSAAECDFDRLSQLHTINGWAWWLNRNIS